MKAVISIIVWAWMFACLYAWDILGMDGAGNLLIAWMVVLASLAVLGVAVLKPEQIKGAGALPRWVRLPLAASFFILLVWFGHGWLAALYALTWICASILNDMQRKHQAEGYGLG
ncbi:MAG: hypothetical protein V4757_07205 [Pseudomonadota bacterium]